MTARPNSAGATAWKHPADSAAETASARVDRPSSTTSSFESLSASQIARTICAQPEPRWFGYLCIHQPALVTHVLGWAVLHMIHLHVFVQHQQTDPQIQVEEQRQCAPIMRHCLCNSWQHQNAAAGCTTWQPRHDQQPGSEATTRESQRGRHLKEVLEAAQSHAPHVCTACMPQCL